MSQTLMCSAITFFAGGVGRVVSDFEFILIDKYMPDGVVQVVETEDLSEMLTRQYVKGQEDAVRLGETTEADGGD